MIRLGYESINYSDSVGTDSHPFMGTGREAVEEKYDTA